MKKHLAITLLAASMFTATACSSPAAAPAEITFPSSIQIEDGSNQVISVTSSEEVFVVPDMAELVFRISSEDSTADGCQQKNTEALDKVLEYLETQGIADTSIQTSGYSLNPVYDWTSGRTITGYEMYTCLTVSDIPLEKSGALISGAVENGVNNIDSVSYFSSKYDDSYQEALQKAIASARTKAEAIAQAGGRTLGGMIHVEEYTPNTYARYSRQVTNSSAKFAAETSAADMAVMPGQLSVEAQVTVEFAVE
ncbi:MAG: SIMPL domain-containing protein [bacterium]|nr:SIMPL domain-containing protein [bacterium]